MTERFDWNTDESVVIRPQPAIAVQGDANGDLLIRQEGSLLYGLDEQFIDVRRDSILTVCRAMLREGGLHRFMIMAVDEIGLEGIDGNEMTIPAKDLETVDRIAEEMRQERVAGDARWEPAPGPQKAVKDPKAAARQRKHRKALRDAAVTVTPVTPRDTVPTAPRLPAELDLLQHGGVKQPVG